MHALLLVNHLWFIVPVDSWKNRASSELLYKSNRPQVSMVYRLINHAGCWYYTVIKHDSHLTTLGKCRKHSPGKCRKHSPAARAFYISLVFSNACRVLSQCKTRLRLLYLLNRFMKTVLNIRPLSPLFHLDFTQLSGCFHAM